MSKNIASDNMTVKRFLASYCKNAKRPLKKIASDKKKVLTELLSFAIFGGVQFMQTIIFNPAQFHLLSLVASSQGLTVEEYVSSTLSRLFKSLADLQGIKPAPQVTPEQVHAPGASGVSAPQLTRSARRAANRAAHAAAAAGAPTPEQAAELARQLAAAGTPAELADAAAAPIRLPGYDPTFTPDPENFGNIS